MNKLLVQRRAKYAMDKVNTVAANHDVATEYARHIMKLPVMVLNNGLGQALAYLLAECEENNWACCLYQDIDAWLNGTPNDDYPCRVYGAPVPGANASNKLIEELMNGNRSQYFRAQQEALLLLGWMTKFANAYLPKKGA